MNFSGTISSPAELKALPADQLPALCAALRQRIIQTVAKTGGHLGASLGAVELAVAVHRVFDAPRDQIIWDTGHQAYAHKLLTGRADRFHTLRQAGGLCGFLRRDESPCDAFGAGHAGTALSAASGMAAARDRTGGRHEVCAIFGDGALTAGVCLEALNNIAASSSRLVMLFNDNGMSISPNVGAIASMYKGARGGETSGRDLFSALGLHVIGPVDGHDVEALIAALERARAHGGPVVVHALTQKGKGYPPAEAGVENLHGVSAFHPETGEPLKSGAAPTWSQVFGDHLTGLARRDPRIAAITAAMPSGTGLSGFAAAFPDRFFDVGIAEQHAVTFACGLAAAGLRPVAAIYSTFLQRAMDQVIHDLAIQKLPVTLALDRAGLVGADGRTHHGAFDLALLRGVPNLTIAAPSDEAELRALLELAIGSNLPFAIRFPRGPAEPPIPAWGKNPPLGIGVSRWLLRRGDIAVLTLGPMGRCALDAIAGCSAPERFGLMDLRFAKPLDARAITGAAASSNALVVIEEGVRAGGVGEAVLGLLNDAEIQRPVIRLGLDDVFHDHGSQDELRAQAGLSRQHITAVLDDLAARFPQ